MFDPRDEVRDREGRENGRARVYDERDREDDPREGLMRDLDLPRGEERELVVHRDHVHELDGEDSRTLAAVGAFRVVPEHDLDIDHDSLEHLHDEGLVETVDLGDGERGLTLTREGRDLLDSHSMDREDEPSQAFYAGVSREREVDHDSNLYATYRLDGRGQDVFGVIAQLRLRHIRARRHQCFGKDGEFADDFFVVVADECAQGHGVLRPSPVVNRAATTGGRATVAGE